MRNLNTPPPTPPTPAHQTDKLYSSKGTFVTMSFTSRCQRRLHHFRWNVKRPCKFNSALINVLIQPRDQCKKKKRKEKGQCQWSNLYNTQTGHQVEAQIFQTRPYYASDLVWTQSAAVSRSCLTHLWAIAFLQNWSWQFEIHRFRFVRAPSHRVRLLFDSSHPCTGLRANVTCQPAAKFTQNLLQVQLSLNINSFSGN